MNEKRDAAIQAAVEALVRADYQLPEDWFNQPVTCSDPDCHVKSRGGAPFSAIAGFKTGEPLNWAFSLRVGMVPGQSGAVLCQHCRNLAFGALCEGKAKELGLDNVIPKGAADEVRAEIEANRQTVREAVGIVFVPLVVALKAYENRLGVRKSSDPAVEAKVQQQLDQPTRCAVSKVEIPRQRDARVVNQDAIMACILQSQEWLKKNLTDPKRPTVQKRLERAQQIYLKVIDGRAPDEIRFISREVAKMINEVIGPQTIFPYGKPMLIWPTFRPDSLVRFIVNRSAAAANRTAARLDEFLNDDPGAATGVIDSPDDHEAAPESGSRSFTWDRCRNRHGRCGRGGKYEDRDRDDE